MRKLLGNRVNNKQLQLELEAQRKRQLELDAQLKLQIIKDEENAAKQRELESQIERQRQEEFQRIERERLEEAQRQRDREIEEMRQRQRRLEQRERENQRQERLRKTTPEALRRLRELIRTRYQMDIYIWSLRDVQMADQKIVIEEGRKADAILQEIYNIVDTWEESGWTAEEWKVAKKIKKHLSDHEQRIWENNPPWNEPGN